jgi:hypothetical protein
MALGRQEAAREAAGEAIAALCSFHQDGKLAYLEALVQALAQRREPQASWGGAAAGRPGTRSTATSLS